MPYIVREGDPLPWFQGTSDALGSLIDVAMRDRQSNQAAARDEAAFGRQRQAAGEDYTRNRAAAKEDYTTRQADENTRDLRNFGQQRDLIGMRQQYETEQANRARTEDADAAATLAPMLNLPVESPMAGGAAGPGPMANYGKMGTKGVLAIAQNQRALADDQRQAEQFDQRRALDEQRIAAMARRGGGRLSPEDRNAAVLAMMQEYGIPQDQAENRIRLVESNLMATSQVMPDQAGAKATARLAEGEVRGLRQQRMRLETDAEDRAIYAETYGIDPSQVLRHINDRIEKAGQSMQQPKQPAPATGSTRGKSWEEIAAETRAGGVKSASQQPAQPGAAYPPDVLTEEDRAEYDALRAEESGGF